MFGCLAYMHVAKHQRSKLDNKSKPCIFLGYSKVEFGYRLWDFLDKKVVRNCDIVFMDTQQHTNAHESRPDDEPTEATKLEKAVEGRRYPLRQRKASSWYPSNEYVLLTNEGEPNAMKKP